jgi:hypothetical protein
MAELDIGSLVVMEHGDLAGMLTFREVIQAVVANGGSVGTRIVRTVMDDAPLTCTPETEIDEVRRMMLLRHARYMPVLDAAHADGRDLVLRRGQGGGRCAGLREPHAQGLHPRLAGRREAPPPARRAGAARGLPANPRMSGSTFGELFRVTNFGESHGPAIGCVIDGCPPGMALSEATSSPTSTAAGPAPAATSRSATSPMRWRSCPASTKA